MALFVLLVVLAGLNPEGIAAFLLGTAYVEACEAEDDENNEDEALA